VWISIYASDAIAAKAMAGLKTAAGFLRGPLARRLHLGRPPELRFHHDRSSEVSLQLSQIVREDQAKAQQAGRMGTGSGSASGSESASGSDSDTGTDSGTDSDSGTESDTDSGTDSDTDSDTGTDSDSDSDTDTRTDSDTDTGTDSDSDTDRDS